MLSLCLCQSRLPRRVYTRMALLTTVGVVPFVTETSGNCNYATAPRLYTRDMVRAMLYTRHDAGTLSILPSRERGFKLPEAQDPVREPSSQQGARGIFQKRRIPQEGQRINMDKIAVRFHTSAKLTDRESRFCRAAVHTREEAPVSSHRPGL